MDWFRIVGFIPALKREAFALKFRNSQRYQRESPRLQPWEEARNLQATTHHLQQC